MSSAPAVTVIIATYNWSEALRVSIPSVLAQTYGNFELIVVGDACTDDSAEVVASFSDLRIRWHNLPLRQKSQSGPNNYGNSVAQGDLVAYLGHDDVWHPEHLQSLVDKYQETGADLVCGVTCMYGPPGSGIRALAGIFVEGQYRPADFFPPSSMMHTRLLWGRIGRWRLPGEIACPVDCDFLKRAHQAGSRIVSTGRLTIFKFNASWRRNSYLHRNTAEQERLLERLKANAARCMEEEWVGIARAVQEKRLIATGMPDDSGVSTGHIYRHNLQARGLVSPDPAEVLTGSKRFSLDTQFSALEWYPPEYWEPGDPSARWSGPSPVSLIELHVRILSPFRLRMQVMNGFDVDVASEITLEIAGEVVPLVCHQESKPALLFESQQALPPRPEGPLRIRISVSKLRCPFFESNGANADTRWLGVCVRWIEIDPVQSLDPRNEVA